MVKCRANKAGRKSAATDNQPLISTFSEKVSTMTTTYHPGRTLAIFSGVSATCGAIGLLMSDAIVSGHWTQDHALVPLVVGLTVATGDLAVKALKRKNLLAAVGFGVAFAVGTVITVLNGMGRQSEGVEAKMAEVVKHNEAIADKNTELQKARTRFEQANTQAEREMTGSRCGPRCNDWKTRAKEVSAHIKQLEAELAGLGSVKPVNAKAHKVGEIANAFGFNGKHASALVLLIEPTLLPFLLEWTAIFAFGYGFAGTRKQSPKPVEPEFNDSDLMPLPEKQDNVVPFVRAFKAANNRRPTLPELQSKFPDIPRSTLYRRAIAA